MVPVDVLLSKIPLVNIFSRKKVIKFLPFNLLGLQTFRVWLAEIRYKTRPLYRKESVESYVETLERDGVAVIEDFLPAEQFAKLEKECFSAIDSLERSVIRKDGPNNYTNIRLEKLGDYPTIQEVMNMELVEDLFRAAERRSVRLSHVTRLLEVLEQGKDDGTLDPETELHEDIFFNTHKAWIYISDVESEHAPFVYVKGSSNNKKARRGKNTYLNSISKKVTGSRRISKDELKELGLEEQEFKARKNTLVIANTRGFHCRRNGVEGHKRVSLSFSARFNPFF